ncbi:response regulator [bacterium]|nr:response regulator [bacterium]
MTEEKTQALLTRLSTESYQRFFKTSVLVYPLAVLYLSRWVAPGDRPGYLLLRACVWLVLYTVERKSRNLERGWLRLIALGYVMVGLVGNALLLSAGGPNLLTVLIHATLVLLGFLETSPATAFLMGAILTFLWRLISLAAGSPAGLAASGLPFSMGLSLFMVYRRGSSLKNLARLLSQQEQVNARLSQAVSLVEDCNALLKARVQERESELKAAQLSLTQVQADLALSHQEQDRLQEQWLQAHRLETLERFGTGLSHSFSNAITSLWMGVERLRQDAPSLAFLTALDDIEEACDRSAEICRRMVPAGGVQRAAGKPFEVGRRLREGLGLLQKSVSNQILLNMEGDFWISGEPALLDQIVWNLVRNAALASNPQDPILIAATRISAELGEIRVEDRGSGIESGVIPFVFEPFYTTRGPGQGHGLGLAIVKEGVERLGGRCCLDSQAGEGTTVRIELPLQSQQLEVAVVEAARAVTTTMGYNVCLVEDQETLRKLLSNYLVKQSHQVVVAGSAEEVTRSQDIQVLITDINLPGISGLDLAHQWVTENPSLKVIFVSGYPFEAGAVRLPTEAWVFVPKPFRLAELNEHLGRLMECDSP